ncbi:GNAT family N-acetyltransferase [Spiractinospora alimapuensis]|uniref:GNAT family N-acetyltransferase n=1 Tax=Spiractinospora alimapuensis TaxID=2820884 RepID=UPI001F2F1E6C|nr:GNAT family N-acetyltransferase [Spiractinospora alimapuensis]QVQ50742.1 GNAT family N-acetyltransferase [Spiractinospora alimapuensis]
MITFRSLTEADFSLLREWLAQPRVARWWNHEYTPEAVARDFGPSVRGEEAGENLVAVEDGRSIGLVQRHRLADYPQYVDEFASVLTVPDGAVSIDYLLGPPELLGMGLGPRMIHAVVLRTWADMPDATCVLVPVAAGNRASWRALEKAGFHYVGSGPMEPDNPADDPLHHVYRVDRP